MLCFDQGSPSRNKLQSLFFGAVRFNGTRRSNTSINVGEDFQRERGLGIDTLPKIAALRGIDALPKLAAR